MLKDCPLGQQTEYVQTYAPDLLYPVSRSMARDLIGITDPLPFHGGDIWNGFELSWLNTKGKPVIALAEFYFPCTTPFIVESKSFKLYLNSFTQSTFDSFEHVEETIEKDLTKVCGGVVRVKIIPPSEFAKQMIGKFSAILLDDLDIEANVYDIEPNLLKIHDTVVEESVCSHLLKSNCMATGQPDWGSLLIRYKGPRIDHESLLKYLISFRNHVGFGEHCVERIFHDISKKCSPQQLTVYARYTRRGGLDINPFRSNFEHEPINCRLVRQ